MNNYDKNISISDLKHEITKINEKLDIILNRLDNISQETKRMDTHVTFVENIYDNVKAPFHYAMNKINYLSKSNNIKHESIAKIENK